MAELSLVAYSTKRAWVVWHAGSAVLKMSTGALGAVRVARDTEAGIPVWVGPYRTARVQKVVKFSKLVAGFCQFY
jgi:hypothetical protein